MADTGRGIPREHLERVFDPFFTTKPVGVGTGLGLSISHEIVRRHDSHIEGDSTPGRGSAFRVRLPAAPTGWAPAGAGLAPRKGSELALPGPNWIP